MQIKCEKWCRDDFIMVLTLADLRALAKLNVPILFLRRYSTEVSEASSLSEVRGRGWYLVAQEVASLLPVLRLLS